jgi:hypothetical protein
MKTMGIGYKIRCKHQLIKWVNGESIHNNIDDECCPDFSCCNKNVHTDKIIREIFLGAYLKGDDDTINGMLMGFLANSISTYTDKEVYITDGSISIKKDMN